MRPFKNTMRPREPNHDAPAASQAMLNPGYRQRLAHHRDWLVLFIGLLLTTIAYAPGIGEVWFFDDFPNIVDNQDIQPVSADLPHLISAALSSPSSEFKRPLASLSFAANFLVSGLSASAMKATNIAIHLANGLLLFLMLRRLFRSDDDQEASRRGAVTAALAACAWMLLPINLTAVLYVVQRMESLANLFVLAGLYGYVRGRQRMLRDGRGFALAALSLVFGTSLGLLAKETAVLLPLYAAIIEWLMFRGRTAPRDALTARPSRRVLALFLFVLVLPALAGSATLVPVMFAAKTWAPRPFTMPERLFSELRIVLDYIAWTWIPTPAALSFYHDDFVISRGWLAPWTTLASALALCAFALLAWWQRRRRPFVALGIALFFACHLLTATIIPLELIYEHRNYPASMGLALAFVSALRGSPRDLASPPASRPMAWVITSIALAYWGALTAYTASRWGHPATLGVELANRAPESPRAQYELGRTMIILSHYDEKSPYAARVVEPLKRAAALPDASILPEQALVFFEARMHRPIDPDLWLSMERKLRKQPVRIEDESALIALSSCKLQDLCDLPTDRLLDVYLAALSHPNPRARLLASYADLAWFAMGDRTLGYRMINDAIAVEPREAAYRVTAARRALALGYRQDAREQLAALKRIDFGGRLAAEIASLQHAIDAQPAPSSSSPTP
jgi:protein O-mannosyl-transferase